MNVVTITVSDLFDFEGQATPTTRPDDAVIVTMVKRQFSFLPQPLKIEISGEAVTVSFPKESVTALADASRLAQRAAKRAAEGNFPQAISVLKRVLELQPSLHQARRDLAMSYMEIGDIDNTKNHLIEVLRLNPGDAWSWVVLGNIYAKDQKEWPTAEKFLRRALTIAPTDPWALNGLATLAAHRGQVAEAVQLFQKAIASRPELPNSHYGLALTYQRANQPDHAIEALNDLFTKARMQDARSKPAFDQGRALYAELQVGLAERQHSEAFKAVENFRAELEKTSGYLVRVIEGEFQDTTCATIQMAWKHGRDHHLVKCRTGLAEHLRTQFMAHELVHLQLEAEARNVGKNRFLISTEKTDAVAFQCIQGDLRKLERKNYSGESINTLVKMWVHGLTNFLYNCPLDMIIETRLKKNLPVLSAAQFLAMRLNMVEALKANTNPEMRELAPKLIFRACLALNGAFTLFLDHLC